MAGAAIGLTIAFTGSRGTGWLRWKGLTFFGLISYAFYMIHLYVIDLYDHWAGALVEVDRGAYWMRFGVCLGVTVGLCLVSRYAIELPAMNLRRYVLKHPAPRAADAGSEAIPLGGWTDGDCPGRIGWTGVRVVLADAVPICVAPSALGF